MIRPFLLSERQMARISPYFPLSHGVPRVDDRRVACWRRAKAKIHHDRCHPSEGSPDRGEPLEKGAVPCRIGRTKGGLNSKLHAVCDGGGKPLVLMLSEGQMSDHTGARLILANLPPASAL